GWTGKGSPCGKALDYACARRTMRPPFCPGPEPGRVSRKQQVVTHPRTPAVPSAGEEVLMADNSDILRRPCGERAGDTTTEDLVVSRSAYFAEIHAALERVEQAYARGDTGAAADLA